LLALLGTVIGCAGPTSPFGAIELTSGDGNARVLKGGSGFGTINFSPSRQMYHKKTDIRVKVELPRELPPHSRFVVMYNGKDVSNTFKRYSKQLRPSDFEVTMVHKELRLRPDRRHNLDFYLMSKKRVVAHSKYLPPECRMDLAQRIITTDPFRPPRSYLDTITRVAQTQNLNPVLLAGLIAQESAFNPKAISIAKAVGLTQVTSLASRDVQRERPRWKRDPRFESKSVEELDRMIKRSQISSKSDWRLNPSRSIEGGALYLTYLRELWSTPEYQKYLKISGEDKMEPAILASYNSGAARVKTQMMDYGDQWMLSRDLREAFKYVNNVSSYCYHFAEGTK